MTQVTTSIDRSKYKTTVTTDNHVFVSDEPLPYGKDLGPSPYDYLLVALGTCVAMTLRMYADRKGWELENVDVSFRPITECTPRTAKIVNLRMDISMLLKSNYASLEI